MADGLPTSKSYHQQPVELGQSPLTPEDKANTTSTPCQPTCIMALLATAALPGLYPAPGACSTSAITALLWSKRMDGATKEYPCKDECGVGCLRAEAAEFIHRGAVRALLHLGAHSLCGHILSHPVYDYLGPCLPSKCAIDTYTHLSYHSDQLF